MRILIRKIHIQLSWTAGKVNGKAWEKELGILLLFKATLAQRASHFQTKQLSFFQHGEFAWSTWKQAKTAWGTFPLSAKLPIAHIPIEITGFHQQNFSNGKCDHTFITGIRTGVKCLTQEHNWCSLSSLRFTHYITPPWNISEYPRKNDSRCLSFLIRHSDRKAFLKP